jgi:hypothetical protein
LKLYGPFYYHQRSLSADEEDKCNSGLVIRTPVLSLLVTITHYTSCHDRKTVHWLI